MAFLQRNRVNLRPDSVRVEVPDNDIARIMYYLNCVLSVIEYKDQDMQRFRNYRNWSMLSQQDRKFLWFLVLLLSPDELIDKCFFHSDELCGDSTNKFYELSQIKDQVMVVQSIVIAGQSRQVNKIMAFKTIWLTRYYYEPMARLAPAYGPQAQRAQTARIVRTDTCVIS